MANEINVSVSLQVDKNGATVRGAQSSTITMAGDPMLANIQNIGTATEAIQLGDISSIGFVFIKNLDATNYVEFSLANDNTQKFGKLLPGEFMLIKPSTTTLYATAHTAACNVQVVAASL